MELIPLLLLPVLMYFLLIRPQQRKMKAQQAMLAAVQEGDEVMTAGGIYGYVNAIEGDTLWLEIAEGVEIRVTKGALTRRVVSTQAPAAESDGDAADDAPDTPDAGTGDAATDPGR